MPEQDSPERRPDPEKTTSSDPGPSGRTKKSDQSIGTVDRIRSRPDSGRPRLDLAVNNGTVRRSLRELLQAVGEREGKVAPTGPGRREGGSRATVARLIDAQEETARRIAQTLHDEASQMLAIVYLELANIARNSPAPTAERIDRVIQHLDSVCEQIRGLSHELHPMVLERHGLMPALRQLARSVNRRSGLEVKVIGETADLAPPIEAAIYRVVQEALSNVVRHAAASRAEVRLRQTEDRIYCAVQDDGIGYRPADKAAEDRYEMGLGLVGICERIDALGGDCHILSDGRKGMELSMGIPL